MVPSQFNQLNVRKLLNLLESSLDHIGRLYYAIGYPIYYIFYRINIFVFEKYKNVLLSAEKRKLHRLVIDGSSEKRIMIEKYIFEIKKEILNALLSFKDHLIRDARDAYFAIRQHLTNFINLANNFLTRKELKKLIFNPHWLGTIKAHQDFDKKLHNLRKANQDKLEKIQLGVTLYFQKQIKNINKFAFRQKNQIKKLFNHFLEKLADIRIKKDKLSKKQIKFRNIPAIIELYKKIKTSIIDGYSELNKWYNNYHSFIKKLSKKVKQISTKISESYNLRKKRFFAQTKRMKVGLARSFKKVRWAIYLLMVLFFASVTVVITVWFVLIKDLPSAQVLAAREVKASTKIYDRNGILLYKIYKDENRTPVSLTEIPKHVVNATLAIEDSEFYSHPGFSVRGMTRAIIKNYQRGELSGGSTITQQLVKNTLLTPEKTMTRKIKEIFLAVDVEMNYTKDQILEMYLNEVSYGGTAYGIQEAAKMYFDKDVQELTLAEATLLAGLPRSPTDYSPFGNNPQSSVNRRLEVLRLMEDNGYITHEERLIAQKEKLVFTTPEIDIKAPHFVMFVREQLEKKYGKEVVEQGGLEVYTTLDYETQLAAEKVVREEIENLSRLNVGNGAAIVMSPPSGEILAMVGSKNYFDYENDGNVNVTTSLRQPGSSIKLVNYAYSLSNGYTPATIIDDSSATFILAGSPPYQPKNYDGRYRGRMSLRSAFAESRNIPAVKILDSYGVGNMIDLGKKMGITTWEEKNRFGLSLTLGGGEVKLTELAQVYATVANYGKKPDLTSILKVTDYKGKILEMNECETLEKSTLIAIADKLSTEVNASQSAINLPFQQTNCGGEKVLDPRVAFMITDILKDNEARTPAFGRNSLLNISGHPEVAVKTGTSNNLRDNLTVGYNQNYLVAVWVGNNDNTPMSRVASGITGASPIFNKIMTYLIQGQPSNEWSVPNGLVKLDICPYTGTLSCAGCPTKSEWFLEENQPEQRCRMDWFEDNGNDDQSPNEIRDENRNNRLPGWIRDRFNN